MEGPSLIILREEMAPFIGKAVVSASGKAKFGTSELVGQKLLKVNSWGKHFILVFPKITLRIHFLMFGSYRINERKDRQAMLALQFNTGEVNYYTCAITPLAEDLHKIYDWRGDIMSDKWNEKYVLKKVKMLPEAMICDILLDQNIFAGSGNIIKNEVLYRLKLNPIKKVKDLKRGEALKLVRETRDYGFDFYKWKKVFQLRKHWKIYKKRKCSVHKINITIEKTGELERISYYCNLCQPL